VLIEEFNNKMLQRGVRDIVGFLLRNLFMSVIAKKEKNIHFHPMSGHGGTLHDREPLALYSSQRYANLLGFPI